VETPEEADLDMDCGTTTINIIFAASARIGEYIFIYAEYLILPRKRVGFELTRPL
jgi:hypothetical protein